jgi:hypothetical protein
VTTESRDAPETSWRNRIVGHGEIAPAELVPKVQSERQIGAGQTRS